MLTEESHSGIIVAGEVPLLRVLLKMALEDAGYSVISEADSAENLLVMCQGHKPSVVVIDFNMKLSDIVRLVESLLDIDPVIAVVVLSEPTEGVGETVLAAGARGYLQEPFSMYDMTDLVRKVKPVL